MPSPSPTVEDEPTPEPTPTLDEAEQLKQDNIDAAKQRIIDFRAAAAAVGAAGYEGWEDLEDYLSPDLWPFYADLYAEREDAGASSDGAGQAASMTVTDYQPSDAGLERVTIDVCIDASASRAYDGDGELIDRGDTPDRVVVEYVVVHNGPNTWWRIAEMKPRTDEKC
ncbi:hypothetical protein [Isoptericola croceus]|uniref:hypothetical protein n=1 Tax=Isoptericola croceus TaxID=3031406 RepID=UPI0023F97F7A|nr:hypothetical protein [Isoptericola croceus]